MVTVNITVTDPAFRQQVIYNAVNLWLHDVTRDHLDACEAYLTTSDTKVLERGDPPVIDTMRALLNGYWYCDDTGESTHPQNGQPLMHRPDPNTGTGWEYECFWVHSDDLAGRPISDLGEGARSLTEACEWFLDAWKVARG